MACGPHRSKQRCYKVLKRVGVKAINMVTDFFSCQANRLRQAGRFLSNVCGLRLSALRKTSGELVGERTGKIILHEIRNSRVESQEAEQRAVG